MERIERMAAFSDWPEEDLTRIAAPTLVVVGDRDVVTTGHALEMSKLIPDARLLVVPRNHGDVLGQLEVRREGDPAPAAVMTLIEEFLLDWAPAIRAVKRATRPGASPLRLPPT